MREKLPPRRPCWTQSVKIADPATGATQRFYLTVGETESGLPREIWLEAHKTGSFARGVLDALARMTSLALQCGAGVGEVAKVLGGMDFPPSGPVSGSPSCHRATSVADWIAQELIAAYPGCPERPPSLHTTVSAVTSPVASGG